VSSSIDRVPVRWLVYAGLALCSLAGRSAFADTIPLCNGECTWWVNDGGQVTKGTYTVDPTTGAITLPAEVDLTLQNGDFLDIKKVWGNTDPVLGFSVQAGTGASGGTFAFGFNLPIALSGPLSASSSVSYSLTSTTAAGAQIDPLNGHVVVAQEVDTSVGGLPPLNKGVDVGDRFFFVGGPQTMNSPVYTASSTLTGNSAYDLMSVTLNFSLSANSNVGVSGFVQQTPVPVPAAGWLLGSGLLMLGRLRRRLRPS
jgi:hypothetical protein